MRDDDVVRLELVEVGSAEALSGPGPSEASATEGADTARRARSQALRGWRAPVAAGVVVVALAAAGGALALRDARESDGRREVLEQAGLPYVDLASPLAESWRIEDSWLVATSGDLLVVGSATPSGSLWRGVDPVTGQIRWEVAGADGWCRAWNPAGAGGTDRPDASSDPTLLAVVDARFDGRLPVPAAVTDIRVLDVATGSPVATLSFPGEVVGIDPVGESVVAVLVGAEGAFSVARADLAGGPGWAARTRFSAVGQAAVPTLAVSVVEGVVSLVTIEGVPVAAFDLETGAALEPTDGALPSPAGRQALADGGRAETFVSARQMADGRYYPGRRVVVVSDPAGAVRFRTDGWLVVPEYSDGSMGDRVLVARTDEGLSHLVAVDVVTGAPRWSSSRVPLAPRLLSGGVLVGESDGMWAVDLESGEELWHEAEVLLGLPGRPVTDGSRLLVVAEEAGARVLAAFDVRSGAAAWAMPAPGAVTGLTAVAGAVVVSTPGALVGYR